METELNLLFRQINSEDIDWILSHTKLSDPIHVSGLEGGWDNANILLKFSNGSEFVLKAWFANEIPEVERVVERHLHLQEHGIPTVVPVLLDNHGLLAKKDGFAWTLMPYIEGGFLGNDSESMESLGEVRLAYRRRTRASRCWRQAIASAAQPRPPKTRAPCLRRLTRLEV